MQPISFKYTIVASGMLLLLCLSATNLYAQRKEVTYKDNNLVLMEHPKDTSIVEDPITGEERHVITTKTDDVLSLNKEKVHKCTPDEEAVAIETLTNAVEQKIKDAAKQLGEGSYNYYVHTVVINKKGNVAYMEPGYIHRVRVTGIDGEEIKKPEITADQQERIRNNIAEIIEHTQVEPIIKDGEPANVVVHINGGFVVK